MADPLNNTNKYLLLSLSVFVLSCVGSISFMRCTSNNVQELPIVEKENIEETKPKVSKASFFEGIDISNTGKTTTLSAEHMRKNFTVKSFKAIVKGSSTLKDWESKLNNIECSKNKSGSSKDITIKIPVKGIKGNEGKIMDDKTYEAFKGDEYPYITFSFKDSQIKIDKENNVDLQTSGKLTMAGTTKPITINSKGKLLENGDLSMNISKKINMTDFNIDPPTVALGTIKVKDEITVIFDVILSRSDLGN